MNRLKELRESKGLTQSQLGDIIGAKKSTISLWESEKRQPDKATLLKLADFYNVSVDHILGRDQDEAARDKTDDTEIRFLTREGAPISPEKRKKAIELLRIMMEEMDDDRLDQATQVIEILRDKK